MLVNGLGATPLEELFILYRRTHQNRLATARSASTFFTTPAMKHNLTRLNRREFIQTTAILAGGVIAQSPSFAAAPPALIKDVRIANGVVIEGEDGTIGAFAGSPLHDLQTLGM